ncbi:hypothetical protein Bbelb_111480 [Branchiostoma belcheri]|nr:hypothetical protein Bbelb_111480 [Branchiostoma belcheri]
MDIEILGQLVLQRGVLIVEELPGWSGSVVLGMNVIGKAKHLSGDAIRELPPERQSEAGAWTRALKAEEKLRRFTTGEGGRVGYAWAPHRQKLVIPAGHEMIIFCRARSGPDRVPYTVLVEPPEAGTLPRTLPVARCYAEVRQGRVPVRVANLGECDVTLGTRTKLGELYLVERVPEQEVDVSISPHTQAEAYVRLVSAEPAASKPATEESNEPLPVDVDVDVDTLTDEQKTKLRDLLLKHKDTFSADKHDFGHTNAVTHRIFTGDAPPSREPYRRIPPTMYKEVKDHIQVMLDKGVIQHSCSPWAAPVVLVRKTDGGLRFCVDYRRLNARTDRDAFPLPRIEESLDALGGAQLFSTLDLASGYWQVEVHPEDREKTAFTSVHGLFEFVRLPFGLSGAPATFSRLMQRCLGDQNLETLLIYLDDIIVFSKNFEEHLDRLDLVFSRLRQYGLKLRPDKCHLFRTSVKYLGHVVSADGVATDSDKTAALRDWPVPTTAKQVRQFLGFASYYRRFVESFGKIAGPLHELTRKGSPFRWTPECQIAFDTLPLRIAILYTDASNDGLGAVLAQKQGGMERVIAYASRSLRPTERNWDNYSSFKLELLALKWAVTEKFKEHLYGTKFTVFTDNNPLAHLSTAKLGAVEQRWVAGLANFDFDIKYRPGKANANADALSRLPLRETHVSVLAAHAQASGTVRRKKVAKSKAEDDTVGVCAGHSRAEISKLQREDPTVERVMYYLTRGSCPTDKELATESVETGRLLGQWPRLTIEDDVLCRAVWSRDRAQVIRQVVLPTSLRKEVLGALHNRNGHMGIPKTLEMVKRRFFWPGMQADVTAWVKTCTRCCLRKTPVPHARPPLVNVKAAAPLELVAMDYLTLEKSSSGHEHVLVITDYFTKYAVAVPTRNQTAVTTAKALWRHFILPYGFPQRLHSDQGANFQSETIRELCKLYGSAKISTTPYHPEGNGQCERFNRTLLDMLGTLESDQKRHWTDYIFELVHAYNNSPHSSTGYSPYYLMFGRNARLPIDLALGIEPEDGEGEPSPDGWVQEHHQRYRYAYAQAQERADKTSAARKKVFDKKAREAPLLPGERVLAKNKCKGRKKIQDKWERVPYVVKEQPDPKIPVYVVTPERGRGPTRKLHRNMLTPCLFGLDSNPRPRREARPSNPEQDSGPEAETVLVDNSDEEDIAEFGLCIFPQNWFLTNDEAGDAEAPLESSVASDEVRAELPTNTEPIETNFFDVIETDSSREPLDLSGEVLVVESGETLEPTDPMSSPTKVATDTQEVAATDASSVEEPVGVTTDVEEAIEAPVRRYPVRANRGKPPDWYGNPVVMATHGTLAEETSPRGPEAN